MIYVKIEELSTIEAVMAISSNVTNDTGMAYCVTKVERQSEANRFNTLAELIKEGVKLEPTVVKGFVLADTAKVTIPDSVIMRSKNPAYTQNDEFEVIWLDSVCNEEAYNGNAGYEIHTLKGVVLRYPDEINKAS